MPLRITEAAQLVIQDDRMGNKEYPAYLKRWAEAFMKRSDPPAND